MTASAISSSNAKTNDDRRKKTQDVGGTSEELRPILKVQDPFLYYSNDRVRMKELRLEDKEVDSSDDGSSSASILSNQEQSTTSCVRKTRITFELHPSLLFEDLMDDLLHFDDNLDASLLSNNQGSDDVIDSLRQIIFG